MLTVLSSAGPCTQQLAPLFYKSVTLQFDNPNVLIKLKITLL